MKAIRDDNLKTLKGRTKIEYIWDYYKLPLAILGILLYVLAYILYGHFTARDPVLYVALVNVNAGGNLKKGLPESSVSKCSTKTTVTCSADLTFPRSLWIRR